MELSRESYYRVLGVGSDACDEEIRRAYRRLAMQWHPDKWTRSTPFLVGEAKQRFQQIQEAYSVLSDSRKKTFYDAGLLGLDDDEDEGFSDFLQEMGSLMNEAKKENKAGCSMDDLRRTFWDMARGFEMSDWNSPLQQSTYASQWYCDSFSFNGVGNSSINVRGTSNSPVNDMYTNPHQFWK